MTPEEKIQQLEGDKIRLQARINQMEPHFKWMLEKIHSLQALNQRGLDIMNRISDNAAESIQLSGRALRMVRENFLLGILIGITLLDTLQYLLK